MRPRKLRISVLTFDKKDRLVYWPDALLSVNARGRIDGLSRVGKSRAGLRGAKDLRGLMAIPGLIDAHCHISQYPASAADGLELLPWLEKHIFPLESAFRGARARRAAKRFFKDLAAHGTTTACLYPAIWKDSTDICFQEAEAAGARVVMGKVMMDIHSYDRRYSRAGRAAGRMERSLRESEELCEKWHGRAGGRLLYAFTPRFALSCTPELMYRAGRLAERYCAYIQTHLSENADEVREIRRMFPKSKSYTEVYAHLGLLGPRTLAAHSIWLKESEYRLLERFGANVVHCPTSNAFLGSGIMNLGRFRGGKVTAALGSDVAAGPSLCMFDVMRQAVYGQRWAKAHRLYGPGDGLTAEDAFYMATLGAARTLRLSGRIGRLASKQDADFTVVDPAAYDADFGKGRVTAATAVSRLVFRGGRSAVRATFVAGRKVGGRL